MALAMNLIGQSRDGMTVFERIGVPKGEHHVKWKFKCHCGGVGTSTTGDWNSGLKKSCGCFHRRKGKENHNYVHGLTKTSYYQYRKSLKNRYGITEEQYDEMYEKQNGKCAICFKPAELKSKKRLNVDHDHSTGKVRGLLCSSCNRGLGLFEDSKDVLISAQHYLTNNEV
jgi:hypothetical protein